MKGPRERSDSLPESAERLTMASALMPSSALATYQPPAGLPARDVIAHARDHIEKLTKKHASLRESLQTVKVSAQRGVGTVIQTGFAVGTSSVLGYVNGRYGGEKGYVAPYSVPVDLTTGAVGHIAGLATSLLLEDDLDTAGAAASGMPRLSDILHAVGDAGLGCGTYRFFHQKGVEHAGGASADKGKAPPGPASPPGAGAGAGQRGTVYGVPQPPR